MSTMRTMLDAFESHGDVSRLAREFVDYHKDVHQSGNYLRRVARICAEHIQNMPVPVADQRPVLRTSADMHRIGYVDHFEGYGRIFAAEGSRAVLPKSLTVSREYSDGMRQVAKYVRDASKMIDGRALGVRAREELILFMDSLLTTTSSDTKLEALLAQLEHNSDTREWVHGLTAPEPKPVPCPPPTLPDEDEEC